MLLLIDERFRTEGARDAYQGLPLMENVEKQPQTRGLRINSEEEERAFAHCQWLYGEGRDREFCRDPVEPGRVWCRRHTEIVYKPASQWHKAREKLEKKLEVEGTSEQ